MFFCDFVMKNHLEMARSYKILHKKSCKLQKIDIDYQLIQLIQRSIKKLIIDYSCCQNNLQMTTKVIFKVKIYNSLQAFL